MIIKLDKLPIRKKLLLIIFVTSSISLLLASIFFLVGSFFNFRSAMYAELTTLGSIIGQNTSAAIGFDDQADATKTLQSLVNKRYILQAQIMTASDQVFASYQTADLKDDSKSTAELLAEGVKSKLWHFGGEMVVLSPIIMEGHQVGKVVIRADFSELNAQLAWMLATSSLAGLISLFCAYFISLRLQEVISTPILQLADSMQAVTSKQDYTVRVEKTTYDELGTLMDGFNEMLEQIQVRDERLANYSEELEQKVALRTQELKNIVGELQLANKAKSQFLANMSHEIRTPLNGVLGMAELLFNTIKDQKHRHYAETIRNSSVALLSVINDILDFSKIEAGQMELHITPFSLSRTVYDVVELFTENAHCKDTEIICLVHDNVPAGVAGDADRIRQSLSNLINNAVKFTEQGTIVVTVSKEEEDVNPCLIRFEVKDTGIGIAPEALSRIFDRFTQADSSMTRKYGGTGLGLTIAKQLAEIMGGTIGASSETGVGSTFWFTARLQIQDTDTAYDDDIIGQLLKDKHFMIVDDNSINLKVIRHQMASWGACCTTATSGEEALALIHQSTHEPPYHAAVLDMMMPGMDGFELASSIRNIPACNDMPLMMLTSLNSQVNDDMVNKSGISCCLTKPVRESSLYNSLVNLLLHGTLSCSTLSEPASSQDTDQKLTGYILIVEDNIVNQEVTVAMLETFGCRVDVAENGQEAIAAWQRTEYDLILMDGQMPIMDGYEATRQIREYEAAATGDLHKHIAIVALTGHAMQDDCEKCLSAGMDDYLAKPFGIKQLRDVLERNLTTLEVQSKPRNSTVCETTAIVTEHTGITKCH